MPERVNTLAVDLDGSEFCEAATRVQQAVAELDDALDELEEASVYSADPMSGRTFAAIDSSAIFEINAEVEIVSRSGRIAYKRGGDDE